MRGCLPEGVGNDGGIAFEFACAEGGGFPGVVNANGGVSVGGFEVDGLCPEGEGQACCCDDEVCLDVHGVSCFSKRIWCVTVDRLCCRVW